jgi:hypothetical protein
LNGTRRNETGRSGGTIRCEIKALAGNSATCLEPISVGKKEPYLIGYMVKEEVYDGTSEEG